MSEQKTKVKGISLKQLLFLQYLDFALFLLGAYFARKGNVELGVLFISIAVITGLVLALFLKKLPAKCDFCFKKSQFFLVEYSHKKGKLKNRCDSCGVMVNEGVVWPRIHLDFDKRKAASNIKHKRR